MFHHCREFFVSGLYSAMSLNIITFLSNRKFKSEHFYQAGNDTHVVHEGPRLDSSSAFS